MTLCEPAIIDPPPSLVSIVDQEGTKARWSNNWPVSIGERLSTLVDEMGEEYDEGVFGPTSTALRVAMSFAQRIARDGILRASSVHPVGDGGVCFAWSINGADIEIEISPQGSIRRQIFDGERLIDDHIMP